MHIAIDAHAIGTGLGGNESYIKNLIEALAGIDSDNSYTIYVTKKRARELFTNRWPNFSVRLIFPHTPLVRVPLSLVTELRRRPVDLLHVQYTAPPFTNCPVIATIHDLSFEHLPQTFKRRSWMQLRLTVRRTARKAAHILTSSEHSRSDITRTYRIQPDRITVTPLAAGPALVPVGNEKSIQLTKSRYGIDGDYILTLSSIQPRKNISRLVGAFAKLRRELGESAPKLVIAGKKGWLYRDIIDSAQKVGLDGDVRFIGYVEDEDLSALYSGALAFVYPSYFEGFGLPPLEAMQCGTPVIAGNRTSLPEVVGDAGLLVDPFDENSIAGSIQRVISDRDLRIEMSKKGLEQAKKFTWQQTARLTLGAYKQIFESQLG